MKISLTVCIPALNEEKTIRESVENVVGAISLCPGILRYEIILVDDGSTDSTLHIMKELAQCNARIRVVGNEKNQGIGFCYKKGLEYATCDYYTWVPSDNTFSKESLHKIYSQIGSAEVIVHYPQVQNRKFYRILLSSLYIRLLNLMFRIPDINYYNGLAVFKKMDIAPVAIRASGFAFQAEVLIKVLKKRNMQITQIPVLTTERAHGTTKLFKLRNILDLVKSVLWLYVEVGGI